MDTMLEATRREVFRSALDKQNGQPCCFTNEEKHSRIEQSVLDAKMGLGVTHDEMFNRHPEWL